MKWRRARMVLLLLVMGGAAAYWWWQGRLEQSQDGPIRAAARRYGVAPALIKAIVWRAGEIGLMQLQEDAAREWADAEHIEGFEHERCLDPGTNALAGAWYLKKLL